MAREPFRPLRFEYVVYPLWRRRLPLALRLVLEPFWRRIYPVAADRHPPRTAAAMARHLTRWGIINDGDASALARDIAHSAPRIEHAALNQEPRRYNGPPLRIPAQWEPVQSVLLSWGVMYPPLWEMHAQMVEAISQVAACEVLVTHEMWARGVYTYLRRRERANLEQIRFLVLPTNDIWIRDYGPIIGEAPDGQRVAVDAVYDVLPQYPQADDNRMARRWAAHHDLPVQPLDLHTEGGNLWSDGQGTLIMSSQLFYSNRYHDRDSLLRYLHTVFDFEKLLITPRMTLEETGHVDLLVKPGNADTVFVSAPEPTSAQALRKARQLFERETNARGQPYHVVTLPTPPLYLNWITYTIRRTYTNALTVNGCVLVPVFGLDTDEIALRTYEEHLPGCRIIPIDARVGINGGGAVHCMTREVF